MAKVIETDVDSRVIVEDFSFIKVLLLGLTSGLLFFVISFVVEKYFLRGSSCANDTLICADSTSTAGSIASIVVALYGLIYMIKQRLMQPLITSVTVTAILWGLASWTLGLPIWEVIIWSLVTYVLAYLLFSWIVRFDKLIPVLISTFIIVVIFRILVNL